MREETLQLDEDVAQMLPESIRDIALIIGLPATLRLVKEWGGSSFSFSKNINEAGQEQFAELEEIIGQSAAKTLTHHYGGTVLYIPRCIAALREARDRAIRAQFDSMTRSQTAVSTVNVLAKRYRTSDRNVWAILKRPDVQSASDGARRV